MAESIAGHDNDMVLSHTQRLALLEAGMGNLEGRLDRHTMDNERSMAALRDTLMSTLTAQLDTLTSRIESLTATVKAVTEQQWTLIRILVGVLVAIVLTYIGARELAPKILGL